MENNHNGCMLCNKELVYYAEAQRMNCAVCGAVHKTNAICADGHYICDECHAKPAIIQITAYSLNTDSKNAITIAKGMMKNQQIHMHGPEHHFLVPAALLTAYANAGGKINLHNAIRVARQRSANVPGAVCGLWGTCGAAIGAGIFTSIITEATAFSGKEWSLSNAATSACLANIAANGGPRCCKRDSFLAILTMTDFINEHFDVELEKPEQLYCGFFAANKQCRLQECIFYPKANK